MMEASRPRRGHRTSPSTTGALQLANELSQQTNGSTPKDIPGGYRWSEHNEAAQFTTHSPEYGQKVVVVVSIFEDATVAVDFFSDEGLSETARYENIAHFLYETTSDLPEMLKDIQWVWETVDRYAESWQEDGGEEVDEARRAPSGDPRVVYRMPTGGLVWAVPDSKLQIMWGGPGSSLRMGYDLMRPGGSSWKIDHPSADGSYATKRDATAAVRAFLAAGPVSGEVGEARRRAPHRRRPR
jgi:hypothetical protein